MSPTNLGALRGPAGYNATGLAEDDAAIAALVSEPIAPTAVGAALRSKFVKQMPPPSGNAVTDTARITAAINALPSGPNTFGGVLNFDVGQYQINGPLPLKAGVAFVGQGKFATDLRLVSGNMFEPTTSVPFLLFQGVTLTSVAGHLFNFVGGGGIHQSAFLNMAAVVWTATSSMMYQNGTGDILEVSFNDCEFNRKATSTVPFFDLTSPAGGINDNTWENCRVHSNGASTTPFWRMEATVGSSLHDNRWVNIVGEQCYGGLVHLYSPFGATFENVYDWDADQTYKDHLIRLDKSASAGTEQPRNISIRNVGTRYGTFIANKYHVYIPPALLPSGVVMENVGDRNGTSLISVPSIGRVVIGVNGTTPAIRTVTADHYVDPKFDGILVANGAAAISVILPPVATVLPGYSVRVMNRAATAINVYAANPQLVNGVAFVSLPQWGSKVFTCTGGEWIG